VEPTSFASCRSDLPDADGNWLGTGRSAAATSSTAGAGFPAVFELALEPDWPLELWVADPPHAPSASPAKSTPRRRATATSAV
jgi:hypothetical protein